MKWKKRLFPRHARTDQMGLGWQALGVFLGLEALGCVVLVLPLPLDTKRSLLQFLSSHPLIAKAQSYLWVIFFLLLALFAGTFSPNQLHQIILKSYLQIA
jgi:hypothetical protein